MDHRYFSMIDMAIVGLPVTIFCIWQLVSINREIAKDKASKPGSPDDASPENSGHPIGKHRLDDR